MKKIKLMLASLSVFAVVSGALAFTAKSGSFFCTADAPGGVMPVFCPNLAKLAMPLGNEVIAIASTNGTSDPCLDVRCENLTNSSFE